MIVLDPEGRIVRSNRACERSTGYTFAEASGKHVWDLFIPPERPDSGRTSKRCARANCVMTMSAPGWQGKVRARSLPGPELPWVTGTAPAYAIATGIDITERKHLEKAILDISEREQRRIGQDLHDGLGQHLTGIAFITKVQEQKRKEKRLPYAADAAKIVKLVNELLTQLRMAQG